MLKRPDVLIPIRIAIAALAVLFVIQPIANVFGAIGPA